MEGECPKCNSVDLEYLETIPKIDASDRSCNYNIRCAACGFEGREVWYLEFHHFTDKDYHIV